MMRVFIPFAGLCLVLVLAGILAFYLPEPLLRDGVTFAHRSVFAGGIFSAALFKIFEFVKGDTKKLLTRDSLTSPQQLKLAQTIRRRSHFLWIRFWLVLAITAVSYGCSYFHTKGFYPHHLLRVSFLLVCVALWAVIPAFAAWRDYVKAKEMLDARDSNIPDVE
jgi:ABC-type branched-subunit amino acid transport system permease subunit